MIFEYFKYTIIYRFLEKLPNIVFVIGYIISSFHNTVKNVRLACFGRRLIFSVTVIHERDQETRHRFSVTALQCDTTTSHFISNLFKKKNKRSRCSVSLWHLFTVTLIFGLYQSDIFYSTIQILTNIEKKNLFPSSILINFNK